MAGKQATGPKGSDAGGKTAGKMSAGRTQSNGGGGAKDRSSAFDAVKPAGQIDDGKYEAILNECILGDVNQKGQSARFVYEIASEGDFQGQKVTQFYSLFDSNGDAVRGAEFLKKDLTVLDYADVKFADLEDVFDEISDNQPGVLVQVKNNGGFVNVYLQGLAEGSDVIDAWRDNRPTGSDK